MLKNVVLPAPFGPIRETIERSSIVKSTSLTATRPPNRLLTLVARRMGSGAGIVERLLDAGDGRGGGRLGAPQLGLTLGAGEDALGAEQHHQHQGQAE